MWHYTTEKPQPNPFIQLLEHLYMDKTVQKSFWQGSFFKQKLKIQKKTLFNNTFSLSQELYLYMYLIYKCCIGLAPYTWEIAWNEGHTYRLAHPFPRVSLVGKWNKCFAANKSIQSYIEIKNQCTSRVSLDNIFRL